MVCTSATRSRSCVVSLRALSLALKGNYTDTDSKQEGGADDGYGPHAHARAGSNGATIASGVKQYDGYSMLDLAAPGASTHPPPSMGPSVKTSF